MAPHPSSQVTAVRHQPFRLWLALVSIGMCWGAAGPLSKLAMSTGHHPIGVAFWNVTLGACLTTTALLLTRGRLPLSRRHLFFFSCCGLLGRALPSSLNYAAFAHLPVGVVVMINATTPMMTFLIALMIQIETIDVRRLVGLGLGTTAVMLIVLPGTSLPSPEQAAWVVLPVVVSLCYAGESVYIAKARPPDCDALTTMCGITWGAFIALAPAVTAWDAWPHAEMIGPPEIAIAAGAVLHLGAYFGFVWLIGRAGPVFATQVGYIVTGTGVVLGIIVYGERHAAWVWLALALIFAGLALVSKRCVSYTMISS